MDYYLNVLSLAVGFGISGFGLYMVVLHFRTPPEQRGETRLRARIGAFILLIGLADLTKAIRDITAHF